MGCCPLSVGRTSRLQQASMACELQQWQSGRGHAVDRRALGGNADVGGDGAGGTQQVGEPGSEAGGTFGLEVTPTGCSRFCRQWAQIAMDTCDSEHEVL
ncbi:hypothetical protein G1E_12175 [Pseudomonas sp. TJI-51]|nr:hypothetical protein G1E_12175 [Pseudomonas sp. TJI-51]RRV70577.1 hypothetical protein EGJ15_10840 [Pseudomonas sp. p99-361]